MSRIGPSGQGLVLRKGRSAKRKRKDVVGDRGQPPDSYGITRQAMQRDLDERAVRDVLRMYWSTPSIMNARISVFATALSDVFSFSIPALGLTSEGYGECILEMYWMPWLKQVYDWAMTHGVIPFYLMEKGRHRVPVSPDFSMGKVVTGVTPDHVQQFDFYWTHSSLSAQAVGKPDSNMYWIRTPHLPTILGELRSPLAAHLEAYRSLMIKRKAENIAVKQRARPTHVIEERPRGAMAQNDDLALYSADFGKAAGLSEKRRNDAMEEQMRAKSRAFYKDMQRTQQGNLQKTSWKPELWTTTPAELLEEADAGFSNRVVLLRPNLTYKEPTKPEMIADYAKAEASFDLMVTATMGKCK